MDKEKSGTFMFKVVGDVGCDVFANRFMLPDGHGPFPIDASSDDDLGGVFGLPPHRMGM